MSRILCFLSFYLFLTTCLHGQDYKNIILKADEDFANNNLIDANSAYINLIKNIPVDDPVINSSYIPLLWRAGYTYLLMNYYDESFNYFSTANRLFEKYLFPDEDQPTGALAQRFFSLKEQKYYLGNYKEKIFSYFLSAFSALQMDSVNYAITEARRGLRIGQDYSLIYLILGNALYQNGEYDDATSMYKKSLQLNPRIASLDTICKNGFEEEKGVISIFFLPHRKWEIELDNSKLIQPVIAEKFSKPFNKEQIGYNLNRNFKDLSGWIGHELLTFIMPIGLGIIIGDKSKSTEAGLLVGGISMAITNVIFGSSDYLKSSVIVGAFTFDVISIFAEAMSGDKSHSNSQEKRELLIEDAMKWIGGHEEYLAQLQYFYLIPMQIGVCYLQFSPGVYNLTFKFDKKSVSKSVEVKQGKVTNVLMFDTGE